jgi:hypothetical protein
VKPWLAMLTTTLFANFAGSSDAAAQQAPRYLHVWGTAVDTALSIPDSTVRPRRRGVVLLTIDLRPGSATRGQVTNIIVADSTGNSAHHTEHALAADGQLFANDFGRGRTHRFDLRTIGQPQLLGSFTTAGPFARPHSFVLLPSGNVLATYQGSHANQPPGGIAEIKRDGTVVRWARAAASGVDSTIIQPYSLEVAPSIDRLVTTSTSMVSDVGMHVQVWRLSDLTLLHTIAVPNAPGQHNHGADGHGAASDTVHHMFPGEPRLLRDGRSMMLGTFTCGLYVLSDLANQPQLKFVRAFPGENCAVPVRIGKWWVQTVPDLHALISLDVSNPMQPREVSRLTFPARLKPHWLAADASQRYLVMNSGSATAPTVHVVRFNPETGSLMNDPDYPPIDLGKVVVPGLGTVRIAPHGSVFQ